SRAAAPVHTARWSRWSSACAVWIGGDGSGYPAAQKAQWCLAAKSVSICGWGGPSDSICVPPVPAKAGQGTADDDGVPVAAKLAQAVRMLAASACWSALSGMGCGALGRSNRYWSSEAWVATGGGRSGPEKIGGALSSLNS